MFYSVHEYFIPELSRADIDMAYIDHSPETRQNAFNCQYTYQWGEISQKKSKWWQPDEFTNIIFAQVVQVVN